MDTVTAPATDGVSWIVDAEIDVPSIGSENAARTLALTGTFVAPLAGLMETSAGATVSGARPVRKYVPPSPAIFPARSSNGLR